MSPRYSIIVPAFNEEVWLAKSLPAIHRAMGAVDKSGELIVVDNNSTDATAVVAERHGAKVVFEPINQISRSRNAGARLAQGAYLVFVDADTLITADLLKAALANLESGTCCRVGVVQNKKIHRRLFRGARQSRCARIHGGCRRDAADYSGKGDRRSCEHRYRSRYAEKQPFDDEKRGNGNLNGRRGYKSIRHTDRRGTGDNGRHLRFDFGQL